MMFQKKISGRSFLAQIPVHARKSANLFAVSTCLKLWKRVEQIFLFHRFLNLMSFSYDLVFSTRLYEVVF